jgi:hypothetical protein
MKEVNNPAARAAMLGLQGDQCTRMRGQRIEKDVRLCVRCKPAEQAVKSDLILTHVVFLAIIPWRPELAVRRKPWNSASARPANASKQTGESASGRALKIAWRLYPNRSGRSFSAPCWPWKSSYGWRISKRVRTRTTNSAFRNIFP